MTSDDATKPDSTKPDSTKPDATTTDATTTDATSADATTTDVAAAPASNGKSRRPMMIAIAGIALLIAGGVIFALGQSSSSKASDDLAVAKTKLAEQRKATSDSKDRRDQIAAALVELQTSANDLLTTADQVAVHDAEIVAAAQAQQQAGVADQFSAYNNAVDRGNAALDALNALIDTADKQIDAFTKALSAFG